MLTPQRVGSGGVACVMGVMNSSSLPGEADDVTRAPASDGVTTCGSCHTGFVVHRSTTNGSLSPTPPLLALA